MAPLVRRTWARAGHPPILLQAGAHRKKVSLAAAIWFSPSTGRLGLFFDALIDKYFDSDWMSIFVDDFMRKIQRRKMIVIWDGGTMHKGDPIRALLRRHRGRLCLERLPPYAPMLNPVEQLWGWLKYGAMCNLAPETVVDLADAAWNLLTGIENDRHRLLGFLHASKLPRIRTLLF